MAATEMSNGIASMDKTDAGSIGSAVSRLQREAQQLNELTHDLLVSIGAVLSDERPRDIPVEIERGQSDPCALSNNLNDVANQIADTRRVLQSARDRVQL